jgi:hypothetical protein
MYKKIAILFLLVIFLSGCIIYKTEFEAISRNKEDLINNPFEGYQTPELRVYIRESTKKRKFKIPFLYTYTKYTGPYEVSLSIKGYIDNIKDINIYYILNNKKSISLISVDDTWEVKSFDTGFHAFSLSKKQLEIDWKNLKMLQVIAEFTSVKDGAEDKYRKAVLFEKDDKKWWGNIFFEILRYTSV